MKSTVLALQQLCFLRACGILLCIALSCSLLSAEHLDLKAPRLSQENILGHKVGIRPCRTTGVRLEVDPRYDRLLIHNYGYGASGITLSLGGAQEATRLVALHATPSDTHVAVLGAGVIGLTTAYDLAQQGYAVRIYACDYFFSQRLPVQPEGFDNTHFWVNVYASPECIKIGGVTEKRGIEDLELNPAIIDQLIENAKECIESNL